MSLAPRIERYLQDQHVNYRRINHPYAETAMGCAIAAQVPPERVAKAVLLSDDEGFYMALIPSNKQLDINAVNMATNRLLDLAPERDVKLMFDDCRPGAVPTLGMAYRIPVIFDDSLADQPECYMEAGDHESLVKVDKNAFMQMMGQARHAHLTH